ncbi:MAG: folylpolyglutamate synthase/dihydrofolate synthase family protein [Pirellulaceae bacterium]
MAANPLSLAYEDALAFLYGRINYERLSGAARRRWRFKLDRMRRLLARIGDPHVGLPCVHVAGTKGKGSTATMISSVLLEAGYNTGLYTSPHLERLEQRMQVGGEECSAEELVALVDAVRPEIEAMDHEAGGDEAGQPTFFEITTAMALLHFRRRNVQAAVLEVGLGGRLDSTNVCQPLVSVITSISFDHTQQLGATLAAIAGEKAGIIKPAVPVVSGVLDDEPRRVIERQAQTLACPMLQLGVDFDAIYDGPTNLAGANLAGASHGDGARCFGMMAYTARSASPDPTPTQLADLHIGMWGRHQANNAAVAIQALEVLKRQGWDISETAIRQGLMKASCAARTEVVGRRPMIMLDVAHNAASIAALLDTLDEYAPAARRLIVFASSKDKDLPGMLQQLSGRADRLLLTRFLGSPRSAALEDLREALPAGVGEAAAPRRLPLCTFHEDPHEAVRAALSEAAADDVVCVTGSFFIAAELRQELLTRREAAPLATPAAQACAIEIPRASG